MVRWGDRRGRNEARAKRWTTVVAAAVVGTLVAGTLALPQVGVAADVRSAATACPSGEVPHHGFADVGSGNVHGDAIACAAWWGLVRGVAAGRFAPGDLVTRGQLASLVHRLLEQADAPFPAAPPDAFPDDDGSVHEPAIDALAAVDVLGGFADGTVRPGAVVTRGQAASMLVRALEWVLGAPLPRGGDHFDDDDGTVHEAALDKAAEAGLIEGFAAGDRTAKVAGGPNEGSRRDQTASVVVRALSLLVDEGLVDPPDDGDPDPDPDPGQEGEPPVGPPPPPPPSDTTAPTGSVVIDGDATATSTLAVTLTITGNDAVGVTEMRVADGTDPSGAAWQPFAGTLPWTLPDVGDGTRSVSAQLRDAAGNVSTVAVDTILVDTTAPVVGSVTGDVTVTEGDDVTIQATVTDAGAGVDTVVLLHRPAGSSDAFTETPMTGPTGDTWSHQLADVTADVEYRVRATDLLGHQATAPPGGDVHVVTVEAATTTDVDPPQGTVVIDGGAPWTGTTEVTLTLDATDDTGVTQMRVANGPDPSAATPQAYAATLPWTLDGASDGTKTVSVQFLDAAGNVSTTVSDTIGLDTTAPAVVSSTGTTTVEEGDPLVIQASVTDVDGSGVASVWVEHRAAGSSDAFTAVAATPTGGGSYEASLGAMPDHDVEYAVVATDAVANEVRDPAAGQHTVTSIEPAPGFDAPPLPKTGGATSTFAATEFLWTGTDPTQTGVDPGTIVPERAAALRGRVIDRAGGGLGGVTVTVAGHPELGSTTTRADGSWDLAVNGGGALTVRFTHPTRLPAERTVEIGWGEWLEVDDVVLVLLDSNSTVVAFPPGAGGTTHQGSIVSDADGERFGALWFPAGVTATVVDGDGPIATPDELTMRVTEYTSGERGEQAMPGELPPTSAFTYAAELSADEVATLGGTGVEFSAPVGFYVRDFIGFEAGTLVPLGTYDFETSTWVPAENGAVVAVVSITPDAGGDLAEIDTDGDDVADNTGISLDERRAIAALFDAGDSVLRMLVDHFTPHDPNYPVRQPSDAVDPPDPTRPRRPPIDPYADTQYGVVEAETQIVRESLPIVGTADALVYASDRVPGRRDTARITLTDDDVPASLLDIELTINLAGRSFQETYAPSANLATTFVWDGLDAYGRRLPGAQEAVVFVEYRYAAEYSGPPPSEAQIGWWGLRPNGAGAFLAPARRPVTRTTRSRITLGHWDAEAAAGLGGWTLSSHHGYDPGERELRLGDGTRRTVDTVGNAVDAVGESVGSMASVVTAPNGDQFYSDLSTHAVYRVRDGAATRYAGTEYTECTDVGTGCGEGGPAVDATLSEPTGLALADDGSLLIADRGSGRILLVEPDGGAIHRVAGTGGACPPGAGCGDNGDAVDAALAAPIGVAVVPGTRVAVDAGGAVRGGTLYVAERDGRRVRQISPDGTIVTIAGGNGASCIDEQACGDGGPASDAAFGRLTDVAADADGNVFVADADTRRVRRIAADGTMTTLVGTGEPALVLDCTGGGTAPNCAFDAAGELGDGIAPATADLLGLAGIEVGPDGTLYLAENDPDQQARFVDPATSTRYTRADLPLGGRVRVVEPGGTIRTVAGTLPGQGDGYDPGDGAPAAATTLQGPLDVAPTPSGVIAVAEGGGGIGAAMAARGAKFVEFGEGRLLAVTEPLPGLTGDEIVVPSADGWELYTFDLEGRHLRTVNALTGGLLRTFGYSGGLLATIAEETGGPSPNVTTISRGGGTITITGPFGEATTVDLDGNGYVASVTDPAGDATLLAHDAGGLLQSVTGARGPATTYEFAYDATGRVVTASEPGAHDTTYVRTDLTDGHTVTRTTPEGRVSTYTVRELPDGSRWRRITYPDGTDATRLQRPDGTTRDTGPDGVVVTTRQEADPRFGMRAPIVAERVTTLPSGLERTDTQQRDIDLVPGEPFDFTELLTVIATNGRASTLHYERADVGGSPGAVVTVTTPEGRSRTTSLDTLGRPVSQQLAGVAPTEHTYDDRGRLVTLTSDPAGEDLTTTFRYGAAGDEAFVDRVTDPLGLITSVARDAGGRITTLTRADGEVVTFAYDAHGNATSVTPPGRTAHLLAYDDRDLAQSYTPPDAGLGVDPITHAYDGDREVAQTSYPDGDDAVFAYDAAGRLSTLTIGADEYGYGYHPDTGRRIQVTSPDGIVLDQTWDATLRTSETVTDGAFATELARVHDSSFRLVEETLVGAGFGTTVDYTWDDDDLAIVAGALDIGRDLGNGFVTGTQLGGVSTTQGYDALGRPDHAVASHGGSAVFEEDLTLDAIGRVSTLTETVTVGGSTEVRTVTYGYDDVGRLLTADDGTTVRSYTYDANGNRLTGPGGATGTYDARDRMTAYDDATFAYDDAGDLVSRIDSGGITTYDYDPFGNLRGVVLPDDTEITYGLDGEGRRVSRSVDGTVTDRWAYDGELNPIAAYEGDGTLRARFVYGTDMHVPSYVETADGLFRIVSDHTGSPRLVVDADTGDVVQRIDYDELGVATVTGDAAIQPFRFQGGLGDPDTGLVRFGARDYDPTTGRFTTVDPILFGGRQTNLYVFANGDPVNGSDPTGLGPDTSWWDAAKREAGYFGTGVKNSGAQTKRAVIGGAKITAGISAMAASTAASTTGIGAATIPVAFSFGGTSVASGMADITVAITDGPGVADTPSFPSTPIGAAATGASPEVQAVATVAELAVGGGLGRTMEAPAALSTVANVAEGTNIVNDTYGAIDSMNQ